MSSPVFAYDKANIFNDLLMTWTFPCLRFWNKNKPSPQNLIDVPKRINFEESLTQLEIAWNEEARKPHPSFKRVLIREFGWEFLKFSLPGIFANNLSLVQAVLVIYLTRYMTDDNAKGYEGAGYVIAYAATAFVSYYCMNLSTFRVYTLIARIKAIIPCLMYKKVLKLSNLTLNQGNIKGKLANLIASEVEFIDGLVTLVFLFSIPTFLIGAFLILGFFLGPAGVIGLIIVIFHFPIVLFLAKWAGKFRVKVALFADSRIKMITNLIEGIRIVKLYGWEEPYLDLIYNKRRQEIKEALHKLTVHSLNRMVGAGGIGIVLFITFIIYVSLGNEIKPGETFAAVTILVISNNLISYVGAAAIMQMFMLVVSMKRLTDALMMKNKEHIIFPESKKHAVTLKNACWAWNEIETLENEDLKTTKNFLAPTVENQIVLNEIDVKLDHGELLIVIGPVGCGKTSLLMGIMQEIALASGKIHLNGKIAYSGEDPWIVSSSIRDNILMGLEYDEGLYKSVIHACALEHDIESFVFGDNTVVGDRGITLSGGQKARVSLARAIYTNRDIMLLDDPLSAVDAEVSEHIFKNCIKEYLKEKTVILATHQIHYISQADKILVLDNGNQLFFGTYQEIEGRADVKHIVGELLSKFEGEKEEKPEAVKEETEKKVAAKDKLSIQEEEIEKGSVPISVYFKFLLFGFRTCLAFPVLLVIIVAAQISYIMIMWWLALWARESKSDQDDAYNIWVYAIIIAAAYILAYLRAYSLGLGLILSAKKLHNSALESVTKTASVFFDKNPTGRMLNRFSKDTLMMDELLMMVFVEFLNMSITLLGNIVVMAVVAPPNLAVIFGFAFYLGYLIKKVVPLSKSLRKIELIMKSPVLSLCNSSVHGLVTIRALNLEEKFLKDMHNAITLSLRSFLSYQVIQRFYQGYTELGATFLNTLNVMVLILYKDHISGSLAAMSISLIASMSSLVAFWAKTMVETENTMASPQRLIQYEKLPREGKFETNQHFIIDKGKIEVDHLFMRYRENFPDVIKDLSFTVEAGLKVGIIGRTGAGKSSIMQVLFRLTDPSQGTIFIDGQDYKQAGLHQLRKQMSVIPQFPTIFMASFKDNLDPFHEHTEEEILSILKQTRLQDLVNSYPKGLNTMLVGEGGNLSAGQKQLVCLARALIRRNKIVMMDEATANVDPETDKFIQKKIKKLFKESTLLIVAHRLRTIIDTDKIIVMDEGTCRESGTPFELGNKETSLFRKMIMFTGPQESQYLLNKIATRDEE
ncbi:unnamed protein product [Blepharisma stoltei]|uniref:Uncharacterized protein n=1 Tax=Blepharisma stoltei TaxID=1481888 RepID=A0AAU9JKW0_9CILI|nr:unnamed protein product [Blepharisma stoltei]